MEKQEIMQKIKHLQHNKGEYEIFIHHRPPEEHGDAVKLLLNDDDSFQAVVFDPDTKEVFSEKTFQNEKETYTFIVKTLEPKKDDNAGLEYIDLDITEPKGTLGD
ncbi:hypothetical protein [Halalkalibacter akibai]|uniref:Uncharacterized protein n=1 Tax=Halalkalibacter akibai (strain ATCC 43226 / DSM 21942 / CIP 109018 / JCM 9157 / 1139) TaxID=1236973 RepID=W4QU69_HALA3|nr:hypothetical protein [Halalkalibacter akibai]GAE35715.1 hypothetical protein JCM9157_2836 [Halalkalibacter akibai JCM 9157]